MENVNVMNVEWVPVVDIDGKFEKVSPINLLDNINKYAYFSGDPVENYVLVRFFVCLSQSALANQCDKYSAYFKLEHNHVTNTLNYITNNMDLFWMDGDKPFLQANEDELLIDLTNKKGKKCTVDDYCSDIQLREVYSLGNNVIYGNINKTTYNTYTDIILDLLVRMTYSVAFGKSGVKPTENMILGNSPNGILNFYATGNTISDTIWMNFHIGDDFGKPVWETRFDDSYSCTFLNRLVSLGSKLKIIDKNTLFCNIGIEYPENYSTYSNSILTTEKPRQLTINTKMWSEYNSMLNDRSLPEQFDPNRCDKHDEYSINSIGAILSPAMGNYTIKELIISKYKVLNAGKFSKNEYTKFYSECVDVTENISKILEESFTMALKLVKYDTLALPKNSKTFVNNETKVIKDLFWDYIDEASQFLFMCDGNENDLKKWKTFILNAVNIIIDYINKTHGILVSQKMNFISIKKVTLFSEIKKIKDSI
jgi:hypothetical protein